MAPPPSSPPNSTPPTASMADYGGEPPLLAFPVDAFSKVVTLHGHLHLHIRAARSLPNLDAIATGFRSCLNLFPSFSFRRRSPQPPHRHHRPRITSDPYVVVTLSGAAAVARTGVISNSEDPIWDERFHVPVAHPTAKIDFVVKDNDLFGADVIGTASIPSSAIVSGAAVSGWIPILSPGIGGRPPRRDTALLVAARYEAVEVRTPGGVRDAYFPVRKGGRVTLYQDAHVKEEEVVGAPIEMEGGELFRRQGCWEDICHAMLEAHHLIYVVGWSIYDKVKLVREPTRPLPPGGENTLGNLLKYKSEEGVRVCLMIWDDKTSGDNLFLKKEGVMQTHDEETRKFFRHSSVKCLLSPRYGSSKLSIFKKQVVENIYSHHQKCVIVDSSASANHRRITAFIGGLDLCDGRYDTPRHRLFTDLQTIFLDDFHNPTLPSESMKGPRQPWHDLHCKIEGPAAYDVLKNYQQRWQKAARWWEYGGLSRGAPHWNDDSLLKLERMSFILSPSSTVSEDDRQLWVSGEKNKSTWDVQIFRSIDSGSVRGFPVNVHDAMKKNLVCGKNLVIDKSIHTAYVQAIRSAQHFIYIENQYFIGSSYGWSSYNDAGAENLIPMEIALKIAGKIRARERFAVYVIIPMFPEGTPTSAAMQGILFWQTKTIMMMYEIIGKELQSANLEGYHPNDFLNFYCLGNCESSRSMNQAQETLTLPSQKFRRFMIYVHSKGMIIDDEYIILGSANINQRSLDGSRDTEIAMGAYQPHHTWAAKKKHPRGQIYGYRMSLWAEHLGMVDDHFKEPHSLTCVRKVNRISQDNWSRFTADGVIPLQGHILKYPILVEADGRVRAIPGQEYFPDVGGKVLGTPCNLPNALLT